MLDFGRDFDRLCLEYVPSGIWISWFVGWVDFVLDL